MRVFELRRVKSSRERDLPLVQGHSQAPKLYHSFGSVEELLLMLEEQSEEPNFRFIEDRRNSSF